MCIRESLGTDPRGNLTRIDNALVQMPQRLEAAKAQLDNLYPVSYTHLDVYKRQMLERTYDVYGDDLAGQLTKVAGKLAEEYWTCLLYTSRCV